jgi:hypothetical protein
MAVATPIIGPSQRACDQLRAELTAEAKQKADQAFAEGDDLHGGIWLRVGEWLERYARTQP